MSILKSVSITCVFSLLFISCDEEKKTEKPVAETEKIEIPESLPDSMYVIAPSGLLLRNEANLQSDQLAKMPYGTLVRVLQRPENSTIEVANIEGNMIQIKYNDITGYAFNGYLTRFKVPQNLESTSNYAERLMADFSNVTTGDSVGNLNEISIPAGSWSEAFLITKQLFDIPAEYNFPGLSGPDNSNMKSQQKHDFSSILEAKRTSNALTQITYREEAATDSREVQITKNGNLYTLKEIKITK